MAHSIRWAIAAYSDWQSLLVRRYAPFQAAPPLVLLDSLGIWIVVDKPFKQSPNVFSEIHIGSLCSPIFQLYFLLNKPFFYHLCNMGVSAILLKLEFVANFFKMYYEIISRQLSIANCVQFFLDSSHPWPVAHITPKIKILSLLFATFCTCKTRSYLLSPGNTQILALLHSDTPLPRQKATYTWSRADLPWHDLGVTSTKQFGLSYAASSAPWEQARHF